MSNAFRSLPKRLRGPCGRRGDFQEVVRPVPLSAVLLNLLAADIDGMMPPPRGQASSRRSSFSVTVETRM